MNESPTDHASDQDNDEDNSSEVNRKDDQVGFIREFQDFMNEAIERLLNKPARRHSRRKDKPELNTEQGKHKESAETLTMSETAEFRWKPWIQTNVSRN